MPLARAQLSFSWNARGSTPRGPRPSPTCGAVASRLTLTTKSKHVISACQLSIDRLHCVRRRCGHVLHLAGRPACLPKSNQMHALSAMPGGMPAQSHLTIYGCSARPCRYPAPSDATIPVLLFHCSHERICIRLFVVYRQSGNTRNERKMIVVGRWIGPSHVMSDNTLNSTYVFLYRRKA